MKEFNYLSRVPQTYGSADDVVIALMISPFTIAASLMVL
jgi:hypothetical protein